MDNNILDTCNLRYFDSHKKQLGICLAVCLLHVRVSVSAVRVIFSRTVSQNAKFCCNFGGVTHFYNPAPLLFHLLSNKLQRQECADASVCSLVLCY